MSANIQVNTTKEYPEVHSLEESLAILNEYKKDLTKEQYDSIRSNIGNHAIESIYLNRGNILALIEMDRENLTADEMIQRLKNRGEL